MKIFLTGASGFLGSALYSHWISKGHQLTALARPDSSMHRLEATGISVNKVVAETPDEIASCIKFVSPDMVVHTACAYGRAGETPLQLFQANLTLGMALIQGVLDSGKHAVFLNTGTVLDSDVNSYALSKNQFSAWGAHVAHKMPERLQFINVRLQHMFGPSDDSSKFVSHVLRTCESNVHELLLTTGTQRRDFIYISDVVSAYDTLLNSAKKLAVAESIDVGTGFAPTVREVVETIHRIAVSSTSLKFGAIEHRPGEAMLCVADITRMATLGWRPNYSLETGMHETMQKEFGK